MGLGPPVAGVHGCPPLLWVTASLGLAGEDPPRHTHSHAHLSLSLETNAESSLAASLPHPLLLSDHTVDSSCSPASVPSPVSPCGGPRRHPRSLCQWGAQSAMHQLCPPLAFSHHLQRLGRNRGKLGLSLSVHTIYPPSSHEGKKKSKTKTKKNLLYRDIFLLYKVCTVPKKKKEKRCKFFFHYCR